MSLLLILNRFTPSSSVFIVKFEQVIFIVNFDACWNDDDDENDDNSHDEHVDSPDFIMNLTLFLN